MNRLEVAKELVGMAREVKALLMPSGEIKALYAWNSNERKVLLGLMDRVNKLADELQGGIDEENQQRITRRIVETEAIADAVMDAVESLKSTLKMVKTRIGNR